MQNAATYVIVKKARGPKGIYREIVTEAMPFDQASDQSTHMNVNQMTDAIIEFYVAPYNGRGMGQDYYGEASKPAKAGALTDASLMPWGKHKDKAMVNVPADYLVWLYENDKCSGPVKAYIEDNLTALKSERSKIEGNKKYGDK